MDLNPRDYRAWYGLGQTYELLHMPFYALNYFRRATQVRCAVWPYCAQGYTRRKAPHLCPPVQSAVGQQREGTVLTPLPAVRFKPLLCE